MRVFLINSVCASGSTGHIAAELCRRVNASGGEAVLAFARGEGMEDVPSVRIGSRLSVLTHGLMTRLTDRNGCFSYVATRRLLRSIDAFRPDIVHLGNVHGYYLNIPLLFRYLKKKDIPAVWTLHDCWAFTGHCSHFTDVDCQKWQTGCFSCPKRGVYPNSWLLDCSRQTWRMKKKLFASLHKLTLVAPSQWLADCLKRSFLKDKEVRVLPNGVDLTVFQPAPEEKRRRVLKAYGITTPHLALGVATPWDERKGLYDLIALSSKLPPEWTVALVALTPKQKALLPGNMVGIGKITDKQELAALYSAADVYVNPTYCDTFPTTNLEALACGTPVAAYRAGGACEAFDDTCGVSVPMGDVDALSSAVKRIDKQACAKACAARAASFDREARFNAYISLYGELLSTGRERPLRVLYVSGGILDYGGISTVMFSYVKRLPRDRVQIDFAVHGEAVGPREQEALDAGCRVIHVPLKRRDYIGNRRALLRLFKEGGYDLVHAHMDAMNGYVLALAKQAGVAHRISHVHNTDYLTGSPIRRMLHTLAKKRIPKVATELIACSEAAGRFMYGDGLVDAGRVRIVKNAIEPKDFAFDPAARQDIRQAFGWGEGDYVVGHMGRFDDQKNHMFLLRAFAQAHARRPSLRLALVGDGALRGEIQEEIDRLDLKEAVALTGYRSDAARLMSAFDLFVLPSKFEGLGIVLIEAQASGLECLASDQVPGEARVTDCVFLPLDQDVWAGALCAAKKKGSRCAETERFIDAGYDITTEAKKMAAFYEGFTT